MAEGGHRGGPIGALRRHPVISGVILGGAVCGAVLGFLLLTDDWSALRRIAAGAVAGAGAGLVVTATKMFG
jgi:hypothetical protein